MEQILLNASTLKPTALIPENVNTKRQKSLKLELDQFDSLSRLPYTENLLYWWRDNTSFPILRKIASSVLAIPLTQVSVERLFKVYRLTLSTERNRLSQSNIEDILFIKANSDLKGKQN